MKLQILDYPFLDAITDPDEKITETDVLTVERMKAFNELYVEKDDDKSNPFVSLVRTPPEMLFGLPPALIITAGMDCLRFEAEKYAVMLIQAGVEVRMRKFLNSNHAFVVHALQEYREAQELIIRALGEVFLYSPRKGR
jgi:acetyl esterase